MSKENLDQFMNQVADSEELQARIGEGIDAETLIALGAEHGCEFSADDLTAEAELSDEELDGVAGGAGFLKLGDKKLRWWADGHSAIDGESTDKNHKRGIIDVGECDE